MLGAQDVGPSLPPGAFNRGPFRFDSSARAALQLLWQTSTGAYQERVACIGGYRRDSVVYVTAVEPLGTPRADSADIGAGESIVRCGPPDWLGTVHTHIARFRGSPFVTFSRNDRRVMFLWRQAWKIEGVFCLLYSEWEAHCEAEPGVAGEVAYAEQRGNRIPHAPPSPP